MPSFRSIFLVATTAFAAFTAAAPSVPAAPSVATPNVAAPGEITKASDAVHTFERRCGCSTLPDLFTHVQVNIDTITNKCHEATAGVDIDINVALDLLVQVKAIVSAAINDVNAIADLHLDIKALLLSGGTLIDVKACATLVANVVIAITAVLDILVKACVSLKVDISAILSIVAEIGVLLCTLLKGVFALVVGIDVIVCGLLKVVAGVLAGLKLNVVVNLLGLSL